MADDKKDPVGDLAEGSHNMHQLYAAYCLAGFTDQQALYLVGVALGTVIWATMGAPAGDG